MKDFSLYVILDMAGLNEREAARIAGELAAGGADAIQYRNKTAPPRLRQRESLALREALAGFGGMFFVNDDPELAVFAAADGVHLGQEDMAVKAARRIVGPDRAIGISVRSAEEAAAAERDGADYLAVGDLFGSGTKRGTQRTSLETLRRICQNSSIPVVGIGGVTLGNMEKAFECGAAAVAVSGAILKAADLRAATQRFKRKALSLKKRRSQ